MAIFNKIPGFDAEKLFQMLEELMSNVKSVKEILEEKNKPTLLIDYPVPTPVEAEQIEAEAVHVEVVEAPIVEAEEIVKGGFRWTPEEDAIVVASYNAGKTRKEISALLPGRTYQATCDHIVRLKLAGVIDGDIKKRNKWLEEEVKLLRNLYTKKLGDENLCAIFPRHTSESIDTKIRELKKENLF